MMGGGALLDVGAVTGASSAGATSGTCPDTMDCAATVTAPSAPIVNTAAVAAVVVRCSISARRRTASTGGSTTELVSESPSHCSSGLGGTDANGTSSPADLLRLKATVPTNLGSAPPTSQPPLCVLSSALSLKLCVALTFPVRNSPGDASLHRVRSVDVPRSDCHGRATDRVT